MIDLRIPDLEDDPREFLAAFRNASKHELGRRLFQSKDLRLGGDARYLEIGLHAALELEIRNAVKKGETTSVRELRSLQERMVKGGADAFEWGQLRGLIGGWMQAVDPDGGW